MTTTETNYFAFGKKRKPKLNADTVTKAKNAATNFGYYTVMPDIEERIMRAKSDDEISNLMTKCRKRKFG